MSESGAGHRSAEVRNSPRHTARSYVGDALIFGDSWADCDSTWPQLWARNSSLNVCCFAYGGCTSADLIKQATMCRETIRRRPLQGPAMALIHIGGNDLQRALAGGRWKALLALVLAFLQTILWIFLRICTAPCYICGYRPAGKAVRLAWAPLRCCTMLEDGGNASFTPEVVIGRVQALVEELYSSHGVRRFVVSGLPVTGALPLLQLLMQSFQKCCLMEVALSLVWLWGRCGADMWQAVCLDLEGCLSASEVLYFDEAEALERIARRHDEQAESDGESNAEDFWSDVLHPSDYGHGLLEADFNLQWKAHEARRGDSREPRDSALNRPSSAREGGGRRLVKASGR